jgi:hypothetical protein
MCMLLYEKKALNEALIQITGFNTWRFDLEQRL